MHLLVSIHNAVVMNSERKVVQNAKLVGFETDEQALPLLSIKYPTMLTTPCNQEHFNQANFGTSDNQPTFQDFYPFCDKKFKSNSKWTVSNDKMMKLQEGFILLLAVDLYDRNQIFKLSIFYVSGNYD